MIPLFLTSQILKIDHVLSVDLGIAHLRKYSLIVNMVEATLLHSMFVVVVSKSFAGHSLT